MFRWASAWPRSWRRAPPITVANDADLGALAEVRRGAARGADQSCIISGEVGVGGGLVVDGKPMTGVAGYAGEVGHMPGQPDRRSLSLRVGRLLGDRDRRGRACSAARAVPPDGGRAAVDAVLREARARGRRVALAALDEVGRWVGFGLAGLVNVLNPRLIVLGGLFGRIHPYIGEVVERELDRLTLPAPRRLVRVVPASLGVDAPLLGAAELAFEPLLADPAALGGSARRPVASWRPHDHRPSSIGGRDQRRSGAPRRDRPMRHAASRAPIRPDHESL